jgi:dimeric dUTPase (all-alpha-NTP-PPase superfamily)|tara:strand:+ start:30355 stop:30975 length:621 start_codon:yes stop_codon:yes gene_type:complete
MSQPQISQIQTMLDLQNSMNTKVNAQWRKQNFAWYRAIWIECAELLDHYGWKWWKHQEMDRDQVMLELIDIWHFGLSILIVEGADTEDVCRELTFGLSDLVHMEFPEQLEVFTEEVLHTKSFDARRFGTLMKSVGLEFEELLRSYVGKNILNMFRQDKGYKDGSYIKIWDGKDDNEWLVEHMQKIDLDADDFAEAVYSALDESYPD